LGRKKTGISQHSTIVSHNSSALQCLHSKSVSSHLHRVKLFFFASHIASHQEPLSIMSLEIANSCWKWMTCCCCRSLYVWTPHQLSYSVTLKLNSDMTERLSAAHAEEMLMVKCAEPKMHRLRSHLKPLDYIQSDENQVDQCKKKKKKKLRAVHSKKWKFCHYVLTVFDSRK